MSLEAILTIVAIIIGPIVAVQLTRHLDDRKERRERKVRVFKILMATRGAALSPAHVEALNMIDLEFSGSSRKEKSVLTAWKAYHDHLSTEMAEGQHWNIRRIDLLVELLYQMALALGFDFDKVHIKNAVYSPRGHGEIEDDQTAIRRGFRELLEWKRAIPISVVNLAAQAHESGAHQSPER